jgi:hypothetical protein
MLLEKKPIQQRIREAFREGERSLHFYELGERVFPRDQYPRAGRSSVNGGPPGYCMALTAAINRMGLYVRYTGRGGERYVSRPSSPSEDSGG